MSGAFLALWNDYPNVMTEEYEAWHTFEHVPERLTASGMLGARRYASFGQPSNRYFTIYDMEDLKTIEEPAYLDLVQNPTVWSAKMRRHFSNVTRIPARSMASGGIATGRCSLIQAYSIDRYRAEKIALELAEDFDGKLSGGFLLGYRIGLAEPNQPYEVFDQIVETDRDTYNLVFAIDGVSHAMLADISPFIGERIEQKIKPRTILRDDVFELITCYSQDFHGRTRMSVEAPIELRSRFACL